MERQVKVHGLFGYPVAHSLSPRMFNAAFEELGLSRTYLPFSVTRHDLAAAVTASRTLRLEGYNLTMPHKQHVAPFLDRLEGEALETGTVNTVKRDGNQLIGHNTDGEGAILALKTYRFDSRSQPIVVVGAGGASTAIVTSLLKNGEDVLILNRTIEKAQNLAQQASKFGQIGYSELSKRSLVASIQKTSLLVNATPLSTLALLHQYSVPVSSLPRNSWVFDLAYDQRICQSNRFERSLTVSPLELLLQQGALSFKIWLGRKAPIDTMRQALQEAVGCDWRAINN